MQCGISFSDALYGTFKEYFDHSVLIIAIQLIDVVLATPSYIPKAASVCGLMKFPLFLNHAGVCSRLVSETSSPDRV